MNERRNETARIEPANEHPLGVGGRQGGRPTSTQGGGYLDICTPAGFQKKVDATDPRLSELRQVGLGTVWLKVAAVVGIESFLEIWRILDEESHHQQAQVDTHPTIRIRIPLFSRYLKFQRNRYVRTLAVSGLGVREIRQRIRIELREDLSERHILRIISADRSVVETHDD